MAALAWKLEYKVFMRMSQGTQTGNDLEKIAVRLLSWYSDIIGDTCPLNIDERWSPFLHMSWFVFGFLYQLNQVIFSSGWFWHFVLLYRGHTVKAVCESFHLSKDAGFKVSFFVESIWIINYFLFGDTIINYYIHPALQVVTHMMPDLPNVGLERDIEQFIVSFFIRIIV